MKKTYKAPISQTIAMGPAKKFAFASNTLNGNGTQMRTNPYNVEEEDIDNAV